MNALGSFVGIGVGPGDPELLTLKAASLIEHAPVVAYLANEEGVSQAKKIACIAMERRYSIHPDVVIPMPMSMDRTKANIAYDHGAQEIALHLKQGRNVAFLCEGDPLFFGSFTYLMERLEGDYNCQIVPGISSIHAAASALKHPLTVLKESFAVVSGRHSDNEIVSALENHDSVVIMKAGSARPRILAALKRTERMSDAKYLEYIGRENEHIVSDVRELVPAAGPYFSLFVVTRGDRNRQ
ncbi:precorrin-2 C(20)-methyltransferase [Marinomonas balearica]|uniref:Precorrin-2/cobalt-factor-2 C20-methyltransferase n=1 Tax=Marinomonas balearica TaxID=491947 RepID=A0A4R6MD16_9GAMM|nr:precorrin-2 C(20)-methyltransferase [Marinomonas balearica]TDO99404.1 precorrin-2/cobalt-factor-2 C20-methyltransferase [Marinomonas balearica]